MTKRKLKRDTRATSTTMVREHPLAVRVSKKNPTGKTIRDRHIRRLPGTDLDKNQILEVAEKYSRKSLIYPSSRKLLDKYKNSDEYDDLIAVWIDYFSKKFGVKQPLDPDSVKALIASESGFQEDPKGNKIAIGITQITKKTLKILLDSKGEAKEFIFREIRQKDLKNPEIAIPLAVRWLYRKQETARSKLGRQPSDEETILEYKGWLKGKSVLKEKGLRNYREHYEALKK
ncbi:MAG: transglycosylase SLT domain-containing protein [Bdellovibrionaceae bacterium]|nr:transglycosylase SLT domain-containing protein [Pseudobdellovibrionaceae bacterium]